MSKFFEALEQAEQERARAEETRREQKRRGPEPTEPRYSKSSAPEPAAPVTGHAPVDRPPKRAAAAPRERSWEDRTPADGILEDHLVSLLNPGSTEAEEYRTLCCALEEAHRAANLRVAAVTSPGVGDGKTVTAINVAATLAQTADRRVLLIDADLRHPSVARHLGMDEFGGRGFADAIADPDLTLAAVEKRLHSFNITVVPAGGLFDSPYEALKSARVETLIDEARRRYDFVLVDTPPVLPVPDCRVITRWIDGFLIVVAAHQTPRRLLEETLNVVDPSKMIGLVFNGDDMPLSDYYGYAYGPDRSEARTGVAGWSERLARRYAATERGAFPLAQK